MRHFCESCHRNFEATTVGLKRCPYCGYSGGLIIPNPVRQYDGQEAGDG